MRKKILYISRSNENNSPVGIRYHNWIKYFKKKSNLSVINLTKKSIFFSRKTAFLKFLNRVVLKIPLFPDAGVLILNEYKKEISKIVDMQFDAVIIGVLPVSLLSLAEYVKKNFSMATIVVDMSDPITSHISFNKLSKKRQKRLIQFEEKYLQYVDVLVVLNEEVKRYYESKYIGVRSIIVIEQGVHPRFSKIHALEKQKVNARKIRFLYAGHFYRNSREPYELYKAVNELKEKIELYIYGQMKKEFHPPKKRCFHFGGRLSIDALIEKYKSSQVIVFVDNKNSIQVPGKSLEILSLNRPILFLYYNINSPSMLYFKKYNGIFFSKNKHSDIVSCVNKIISTGKYYYERDLSEYQWENLFQKMNNNI